jgi:hypothetical protein
LLDAPVQGGTLSQITQAEPGRTIQNCIYDVRAEEGYKNATHGWDQGRNFTWKGMNDQEVVYRHNAKATAESVRLAFDFLDSHVKRTDRHQ